MPFHKGLGDWPRAGFAKRVEDLVKISEKVQKLIKEKDTDGVVSYTYHDETSTAQTLQAKLSTLERYAENVNTYINKKIDRPFYEAMDKVGAKLEALNIQKYKTTNKIGYKRIESVKDAYGHPVGTKEVTPPEIGIDELYKVDSPYKASLKKSYEEYRKSKDYKDHRLTETEYVQVMHQTRSFEYVSIDDEKSTTEMWRDLTLTAATVVLYVFCPPAGAVLSTVAAAAEMYSAASGKDWGTGRELDGNERAMRGAFALLDLIPAGKYLSGLAKTGKTAGLTAVKTSIKTAVKEGVEQGAKNFDTFKGLLKKTKGLGDNIYHSLPTYRKQLARHLQNTVDEGLLNLSRATQEGLERAKQFTLEVPTVVVRETSTGSQMMRFEKMSKSLGDTGLGKSLDNLASKAKNVENASLSRLQARNAFYGTKVDDVVERLSQSTLADNINVVKTVQADEVNTWWKTEMGYDNPPYKPGTSVDIISLKRETTFVRVYDGEVSGQFGGWLMNLDDIKGLTPEEIRDVYALPAIPKYMTDVTLESGTTLRTGIVNPLEGWGKGGARQFDLMGQRTGKFTNERLIQW